MPASGKKKELLAADSPLSAVKGVGAKTAAAFAANGLVTVEDLLRYYPRTYDVFAPVVLSSDAAEGQIVSLRLVIRSRSRAFFHAGRSVISFTGEDAGGTVRLTWFNQPYLGKTILPGSVHVFRGTLKLNQKGGRYLEQPGIYAPDEYAPLSGTLQPRYSLPQGLKNGQFQRAVQNIFRQLEETGAPGAGPAGTSVLREFLPDTDREALGLIPEQEALKAIHFPENAEHLSKAMDRLVFDEFCFFLLQLSRNRRKEEANRNPRPMLPTADPERLIEALPYRLTDGQQKAWAQIRDDLCGDTIMNRLLQGDVGSGKTILAFLALVLAASNGRQGAMMAPTEVLAVQHMEKMTAMAERYHLPVRPVLLTGSIQGRQRTEALQEIASGEANVIIGTHALIQDPVAYHDLGLVITDEQHRFGVRQREKLAGKGEDVPILVMSATPIPRTLAIILYGDLKVSLLTELPANRLPIRNTVLDESWRDKAYRFIEKEIRKGHQAYIICPAIEAGETDDLQNVEDYVPALRSKLPADITISALNGRMKPAAKKKVMEDFGDGRIDILVSTTVVEVGIDVPNATVMMVENAERFGLSQLHQLRGRVGRGKDQSYCIFLYGSHLAEKPERLHILEQTNDGFRVAEEDLKLRGPGDLFGIRQSGALGFTLADIYRDADLLKKTSAYTDRLLKNDPGLELPEHAAMQARVSRETAKSVDFRSI